MADTGRTVRGSSVLSQEDRTSPPTAGNTRQTPGGYMEVYPGGRTDSALFRDGPAPDNPDTPQSRGFRIGGLEISPPVCLGPMAGVTDLPFRTLCKEQGCGLMCTEMVSAKAMYYGNSGTEPLLRTLPSEHPVAVQMFGSEPELMADMARRLEELPFDMIDINMGCPVPKVVNNGEGSALMKDPAKAGAILGTVVRALKKPVTVKIRLGWDARHINAAEIARIAEDAGAAAVTVHGRTREQYYAGRADWEEIRRVKEAVSIPVIGNGDVTDAGSALRLMEETGCDGVMIGRAARGNPWIFREVTAALRGEEIPPRPSFAELCATILRHASMQIEEFGEHMGILQMRKQVAWYTAGYPHSAWLRREVNSAETIAELKSLLTRYEEEAIIFSPEGRCAED